MVGMAEMAASVHITVTTVITMEIETSVTDIIEAPIHMVCKRQMSYLAIVDTIRIVFKQIYILFSILRRN